MMSLLRIACMFACVSSALADAALPRTAIGSAAKIDGREVSRLYVAAPIYLDIPTTDWTFYPHTLLRVIPPGEFRPVSEDRDGIFFESAVGLGQPQSVTAKIELRRGGLYASKKQPMRLYPYFGDASPGKSLHKAARPLPAAVQKQIVVGQPKPSRGGKSSN